MMRNSRWVGLKTNSLGNKCPLYISTSLNWILSYQLDIRNSLAYRFKAAAILLLAFSHARERTGHKKEPSLWTLREYFLTMASMGLLSWGEQASQWNSTMQLSCWMFENAHYARIQGPLHTYRVYTPISWLCTKSAWLFLSRRISNTL